MTGELRVLVADDNPDFLGLLGELLETERCRVTLCSDGVSALARIAAEPFHLVVSDITMPGFSGLDILDKLSAMAAEVPVVLISGDIDRDKALFALRRGAFDYLLKPFHLDDIRGLVRRVQRLYGVAENGAGERVSGQTGPNGHRPQEILIKKSRALQLIARSGEVLGSAQDLGRLMGDTVELAMRGVGADFAALLVASEADGQLSVAVSKGLSGAVKSGDEVRSVDELWALIGLPSGSASTVVPLTVKGRRVGWMAVAGRHEFGPFSVADQEMLGILAQQASMALENASLYATVESSVFEGMRALVATLEAKDPYTEGHSLRLARVAVAICRQMGLASGIEDLTRYAGVLHDIGKIGIPDAILGKPGSLTPEEYERMKEHPVLSWKILLPFSFLQEEALIVRHHHEWVNGKGYPDGLSGSAIPLPARILAVADAYDAMTTTRPYRAPRTHDQAIAELRFFTTVQFDPDVVEAFASLPPFPHHAIDAPDL